MQLKTEFFVFEYSIKSKEMKEALLVFLIFAIALPSHSQKREERKLENFTKVKVSSAIELYLQQGNETKAIVETDEVDLDQVITEVSGEKLKISLKKQYNFRRNDLVKVFLTYKSLKAISASSRSIIYSDSVIKVEDLEISVSSAASLELNIDVDSLYLSACSAGDIYLFGQTEKIIVFASSASNVNAFDLVCKNAEVTASSAGSININITEEIEAKASGGGSVKYKGNPSKSNTDSSSGGSVRKLN